MGIPLAREANFGGNLGGRERFAQFGFGIRRTQVIIGSFSGNTDSAPGRNTPLPQSA